MRQVFVSELPGLVAVGGLEDTVAHGQMCSRSASVLGLVVGDQNDGERRWLRSRGSPSVRLLGGTGDWNTACVSRSTVTVIRLSDGKLRSTFSGDRDVRGAPRASASG